MNARIDPFHRHTFRLVKAGEVQVELITLMMAVSHLGEPVLGLWYYAFSLTDMAYWDTK